MTRTLLEAALKYAANGLKIIPLHPATKKPAFVSGPGHTDLASSDPEVIKDWWASRDFNIGIPCSEPNRLAVIDIDTLEGQLAWEDIPGDHTLPDTLQVRSGRAGDIGAHIYFHWPPGQTIASTTLAPGLDLIADGKQIVAPPSIHPDTGNPYTITNNTNIAIMPTWLAAHKPTTSHTTSPNRQKPPTQVTTPLSNTFAQKRLQGLCAEVAAAPEGERNNRLNHAAYTAGRLIASGHLHEIAACGQLMEAAETAGLDTKESTATINSGIDAGEADGPDPDHTEPKTRIIPPGPLAANDNAKPEAAGEAGEPPFTDHPTPTTDILQGEWNPPTPAILERTDHKHLIYPGYTHAIYGEPETGKSWIAVHATAQIIQNGGTVAYIDYENAAANIVGRLRQLLQHTNFGEQFHHWMPQHPYAEQHQQWWHTHAHDYQLVILDGLAVALALNGYKENDNTDIATFYGTYTNPIAHQGPAVLVIDHITKADSGRWARGAGHKLAGLTGAAYKAKATEQPLIMIGEGRIRLELAKDRHGPITIIAEPGKERHVADFHLEGHTDGTATARLEPPPDPAKIIRAMILNYLEDEGPASKTTIEKNVRGKATMIRTVVTEMDREGYIEQVAGPRGGFSYYGYVTRVHPNTRLTLSPEKEGDGTAGQGTGKRPINPVPDPPYKGTGQVKTDPVPTPPENTPKKDPGDSLEPPF